MTKRFTQIAMAIAVGSSIATTPVAAEGQSGDGYLLKQPRVTLKFESGYAFQQARSDIFDFVVEEHTLDGSEFNAPYFGGELGLRVNEKLDLSLSIGFQESSTESEFRDWVDQDDLPISQVTGLSQLPATIGVKFYPFPRGRSIGRFAWVPRTISPFVGGSIGLVSYDFEQFGDFIDYETLDIFYDDFVSQGEALLARASAGVNVSVGPQFLFSVEGRYNWAQADMEGDYFGFDPIDLDGLQIIGGLAVRF
ncbi:MAG: hypothetical protein ACPGPI_01650 [Longimicrobiales bacterium]